jgi:hypothetical protein
MTTFPISADLELFSVPAREAEDRIRRFVSCAV